jgi:signal transduction histidine kinase
MPSPASGVPTRLHPLDLVWAAFSIAMFACMVLVPGVLTIPYHLIFLSLTLMYGFRLWRPRTIITVLLVITVVTGAIFARSVSLGNTPLDDVAEVPLMPLITALMAWHAWRGAQARRRLSELATLEGDRAAQQRDFLRDSSHAIRTPVTIARGHIELLRMQITDPELIEDSDVVLHQLDRLNHLAGRLLSIEQLRTTSSLSREPIPILRFVSTLGRRWSASVVRHWQVPEDLAVPTEADRALGQVLGDPHRLEEALDALVENALRFTGPADTVRISAVPDGAFIRIEVADSGPGVPEPDRSRVFERFYKRHPSGEEPGTGLGLALVDAVATAHGGRCWVETAPEGGALFALALPRVLTPRPGVRPGGVTPDLSLR